MSLLALLLASAAPCAVLADPSGGNVSAGYASISSSGNNLTIKQTTDKAIIDWRGFNIASGETTTFKQPSSSSLTLNRVNSASASIINGNLNANGNIVIIMASAGAPGSADYAVYGGSGTKTIDSPLTYSFQSAFGYGQSPSQICAHRDPPDWPGVAKWMAVGAVQAGGYGAAAAGRALWRRQGVR